jgi:hypothetical protein
MLFLFWKTYFSVVAGCKDTFGLDFETSCLDLTVQSEVRAFDDTPYLEDAHS